MPFPARFDARVESSESGATLAAFLRARTPGLTWSEAREICRGGRITVDGRPTREDALRLRTGQRVEVVAPGAARRAADQLIVHLDRDVAVVRKPAGLLTVPYEDDDKDTLQQRAAAAVRRRDVHEGIGGGPALRVVQRLDKETSGVLVFARNIPAERHLQRQFKEHSVWWPTAATACAAPGAVSGARRCRHRPKRAAR
jgi:23S rRNA pseudouridine1911/1915/1917 synthase